MGELQDALAEWQAYAQACRGDAQRYAQRVAEAESDLVREREAFAALLLRFELLRRQSGRDVPAEVAQDVAEDVAASTVGEAYRAWCQQGGPLVSRGFMFQRTLAAALPHAEVLSGFLVSNNRLVFDGMEDEMWVVRVSEDEVYGLPVPLSPDRFGPSGSLVEVMPGATPRDLEHVRPARLMSSSDGFALARSGVVQ